MLRSLSTAKLRRASKLCRKDLLYNIRQLVSLILIAIGDTCVEIDTVLPVATRWFPGAGFRGFGQLIVAWAHGRMGAARGGA